MPSSAASARSRSQAPAKAKRLGNEEPRIWTRPLRKLTPRTSLGFSVIEFAEDILGVDLLPWQRWLLIHMLELLPDNSLRFRTVVVLVARQNGKSTLSQVLALWFMYVYGVALVIGTAQDLDVAEEIWMGAVELAEEAEDLAPLIEHVNKTNGKKALELKSGERYKVKAANRRAGRGLSGDLVLLDELREHQSWEAWGAITKTTMARAMALIVALSNAGDATSIVLRYLRQMCLKALVETGDFDELRPELVDPAMLVVDENEIDDHEEDEDTLGIFEWSAPPGIDVWDRDGWAQANPSLGHTITERTIASACRTDPEWIFRTEVLCQWSDGVLEGPFPPGSWDASADSESKRAAGSPVALCVAVSEERATTHVCLAARRADGIPHIEVITSRPGTDWVVPWFTSPERSEAVRKAQIAVHARGAPESSLIGVLEKAKLKVVPWGSADIANATGSLYDRVRFAIGMCSHGNDRAHCREKDHDGEPSEGVRHMNQPVLNAAAAMALPKLTESGAFVWDRRKSQVDVAPLHGVTGALWLLTRNDKAKTPTVHAWPEPEEAMT